MSMINKLSIRGIRSFGTSREDEQKITFNAPLTLIVGENGCGKTTVIECLKFGITGEMPPGSGGGKLFVNDPKLSNATLSHAQVKLQITNAQGDRKQCIRTMTVEYPKNKTALKFKTIDSTIRTLDKSGSPIDEGSSQLKVVNHEMASAMGVSKAILDNVIFCHQEDSAWPLDEGQKLKLKFDAIFGTTEYNKAIDKIIKMRKNHQEKLKLCVQEKRFLLEIKNDTDRKNLDFDILNTKHAQMETKIDELEKKIDPINKRLEILLTIERDFAKLQVKEGGIRSTIENCKVNETATRSRIKELLAEDVEEIEEKLQNFLALMDQQKAVLKDTRDKQTKLEGQEKKLGESIIINKSKVDTAVDNIGLMQELVEQRVKAIKTLCEMLDLNLEIDMESQSLSVEDLSSSLHRIQRAIEDKEDELMMLRAEDCSKEDELQRKIDVVRDEKTAVDTNISTQRDRIRVLTTEHEKVKQEVTRIERSMPNLPQLATQIEAAKIELEKFKSENDVKDLEDERVLEELDKEDLDVKAEKMMCQVEKLESISKFTNEIELKQRELTRDENEFERTKNNQSNTLKQLFPGKKIEKNFKSTVQVFSDTLAVEVKEIKVDLHHAKMADSRLRTEREHLRKQYKIKEKECREANDKVRDTTYGADFMSLLATQQEKVSKLTMELAFQRSSKDMMSHYIDDIDTEPACPLCSKHLDVTDCSDLKEKIQEKIHQLPVRINDTDKKLKTESKRLHEISECKPTYDGMEKLEKDVKKLQLDLDEVEGKFRENSSKIEDLEMQIVEPESKQSMLNGVFVSDMLKLDDLTKGIARKAQEIKDLKAKLPGEMPEKSLDDSKNELRQLNVDIKSKSEVIKTLNFKINQIQSKLNQLQDKLNKMVGQKMEFQEKIQGLDQMRSQMKEKEKEKQKIEEKLKEDREKLQPMMVKLSNLSTQKETLKKEAEVRQKSGQETLNKLQNSQKDIDRQSKEVKSYEDMNWQQKLMECEKKIAEADENLKKLQTEKIKNSGDIQKYENEVRDQEGNKRNLMDNMELMKIQQQLKAAEEELKNLRKTIGDMDPRKVFAEKKELHETREKLNNERSMVSGQISESKNQITKEKKELSNPKYRDARKNYLCCCYDEAILTAMIGDFHKYQVALERGLLKFHSDKMVQINQSIRSYWNSIYKGNDIDYIMIKTDEEEQKATVSEKKRSYSYRVVQGKNGGSEIDMRGRCSAGQKVLASLIIRMALADTFAANCGILALDEPTTNLDQKNIQALCEALNKIIEERESIGNFMLLVITHDEEFVRVLQNVEDFFKLSRDPNGRSRIERITKE